MRAASPRRLRLLRGVLLPISNSESKLEIQRMTEVAEGKSQGHPNGNFEAFLANVLVLTRAKLAPLCCLVTCTSTSQNSVVHGVGLTGKEHCKENNVNS